MFSFDDVLGVTSLDELYSDDGSLYSHADVINEVMTLLYSSGTTGLPKGVIATHKNWLASIATLRYSLL
jgi:long-subunit acyl-CoA synthetase (AMP-forming)